jgi:hypothetical protein
MKLNRCGIMKTPSSLTNDELDAELEIFYNCLRCFPNPGDLHAMAYCYHQLVEEKITRLETRINNKNRKY